MDVFSPPQRLAAFAAAMLISLPSSGHATNDTAQASSVEPTAMTPNDSEVMAVRAAESESAADRRVFRPFAVLTAEAWHTAGGRERGDWWDTLVDFGFELDTAQLGGPPQSAVIAQAQWMRNRRSDSGFSDYTGAFNPVSNTFASDRARVFNLHYRQSWAEGTRAFKIGQLALDDDFMRSDYSGLFLNPAFGPLPSQVGVPLCAHCHHAAAFPFIR